MSLDVSNTVDSATPSNKKEKKFRRA